MSVVESRFVLQTKPQDPIEADMSRPDQRERYHRWNVAEVGAKGYSNRSQVSVGRVVSDPARLGIDEIGENRHIGAKNKPLNTHQLPLIRCPP
jgi:hypothetical protein